MYVHKLESHDDIGYSNFFNTFRNEYNRLYDFMDVREQHEFINNKLKEYNTHAIMFGDNKYCYIVFESKKYYDWFLLKWQ
jgi:hypothetical protein